MDPTDSQAGPRFTLDPQRSRPLRVLRELWWSRHHRRCRERLSEPDHRHPLDGGDVADAMARQIEEIRNLPEAVR